MKIFSLLFMTSFLLLSNCEDKKQVALTPENTVFLDQLYQIDLNQKIEVITKKINALTLENPDAIDEINALENTKKKLEEALKASGIRLDGIIGPVPIGGKGPCILCPSHICCPSLSTLFITLPELKNFKAVYLDKSGKELKTIVDKSQLDVYNNDNVKGFLLPLKLESAAKMAITMQDINNKPITLDVDLN